MIRVTVSVDRLILCREPEGIDHSRDLVLFPCGHLHIYTLGKFYCDAA